MEYSFSNISGDDNLVEEEAFDLAPMKVFGTESPDQLLTAAAAADRQIENNFSLKDVIEEITETRNGGTKTDIGDAEQNSSVDETKTADDDNDGQNSADDEYLVSQLGYADVESSSRACAGEWSVPLLPYADVESSSRASADECSENIVGLAEYDECSVNITGLADYEECLKNKHIFYYGGKDEWIQKFVKKATALANDLFLKDFDINIELYHVEEKARGEKHRVQKFCDHLKGLLSGKDKKQVEPLTKVIEKLLSDDPSGWAVLSRDSKNPITGDRETFLRVIEEFDQWKKNLVKNRFDLAFKNYYDKISLHVSTAAGK